MQGGEAPDDRGRRDAEPHGWHASGPAHQAGSRGRGGVRPPHPARQRTLGAPTAAAPDVAGIDAAGVDAAGTAGTTGVPGDRSPVGPISRHGHPSFLTRAKHSRAENTSMGPGSPTLWSWGPVGPRNGDLKSGFKVAI